MIIKTKYMSFCPRCSNIIPAQTSAVWEKGQKPIHPHCDTKGIDYLLAQKQGETGAKVAYCGEENGFYKWSVTLKCGKVNYHFTDKSGERIRLQEMTR